MNKYLPHFQLQNHNPLSLFRIPLIAVSIGLLWLLVTLPVQAQGPVGSVKDFTKITHDDEILPLDDLDGLGDAVTTIGDFDNNGVIDLAVLAQRDDDGGDNQGAIWLLFMNDDGTIKSTKKISNLPFLEPTDIITLVASIGDLNKDGVIDLAVGHYTDDDGGENRGAIRILFLNADGSVKAHQKISSTQGGFTAPFRNGNTFGVSITPLGDLDGDTVLDIAVGAAFPNGATINDTGAVFILFLNTDGTVKAYQKITQGLGGLAEDVQIDRLDRFGISLATIGDLNNDNIVDLAVGAYRDDDGGFERGAVWILFLNTDGTVKAHQKISDTQGNFSGTLSNHYEFGIALAGPGDIDRDGVLDLVVSSVNDTDGGTYRIGAVWILFLNTDGTVKAHQKISNTQGNFTGVLEDSDYFGRRPVGIGDFNKDGTLDLAVGAVGDDDGGDGRGAVYLLYLDDGEVDNSPPDPDPETDKSLLAIYALAFDNDPTSPSNLAPEYWPVLNGIIKGTINQPDKTAVVLGDLTEDGDTHIRVIQNGAVSPIIGVPDPNANCDLVTGLEYDMANGQQLGCFIKWARATYAADKTIFSYISHGMPLVPETSINNIFNTAQLRAKPTDAIPLPNRAGHPDFTDNGSQSLISAYDLAEALRIGTNDGEDKLDVVDTVHCFSASIEEFYELHPYAIAITGAPNYTYLEPVMLGNALSAIDPSHSATTIADNLIETYHNTLPNTEHPHILVAVESDQLPQVKSAWDKVSFHLLDEYQGNPSGTRTKIKAAYATSAKYDTDVCPPQDWELTAPDGLSDMMDFATQLANQSWSDGNIAAEAINTTSRLNQAIIAKYIQNGEPWFPKVEIKPNWNFSDNGGLALYTDLQGEPVPGSPGKVSLSFQGHWYDKTASANNPYPYTFIQDGANGVTWSDVFQKLWEGEEVQTGACLPEFPVARTPGEISAERITQPKSEYIPLGQPIRPEVIIGTLENLPNLTVQFNVYQNNTVVFSNTVASNYLIPGTYHIEATQVWTPTSNTAAVFVEAIVDADDRIIETIETNNQVTKHLNIISSSGSPPTIEASFVTDFQWTPLDSVAIEVNQLDISSPVDTITAQVYTYRPGTIPNTQIPQITEIHKFNDIALPDQIDIPIPKGLKSGPLLISLLASGPDGVTLAPVNLEFNYIPPHQLNYQQEDYFLIKADANDTLKFDVKVPPGQNANIFVWDPISFGPPTWQATVIGDDQLNIVAPLPGQYIIGVRSESLSGTFYTLTASRNGVQFQSEDQQTFKGENDPDAYIPQVRQHFESPNAISINSTIYLPLIVK